MYHFVLYKNQKNYDDLTQMEFKKILSDITVKNKKCNDICHGIFSDCKLNIKEYQRLKFWDFMFDQYKENDILHYQLLNDIKNNLKGYPEILCGFKYIYAKKECVKYYFYDVNFNDYIYYTIEKNNKIFNINNNLYKKFNDKWIKNNDYFSKIEENKCQSLFKCELLINVVDILYSFIILNILKYQLNNDILFYIKSICCYLLKKYCSNTLIKFM